MCLTFLLTGQGCHSLKTILLHRGELIYMYGNKNLVLSNELIKVELPP